MIGGTFQTVAGAGAGMTTGPVPEPITKTVATTAIVRGVDNFSAGFMQTWTGKEYDTVTARGFYNLLVKSGVDRARASKITGWTELGVDVASSVGSGLIQAVNAPALTANVARTFESSKYTVRVLQQDTVVFRAEGGRLGRWFGTTRPGSAAEAERMYNVIDYGNDLAEISQYTIPKGTLVYEGQVAGGTATQMYVPDPLAAGVKLTGTKPLPQFGH